MPQEPLPQEPGQSSLPLDPHSPSSLSGARIRGLNGLAQKALPDRAGAHLRALTYWSSFMPRDGKRLAEYAPALYVDRGDTDNPEHGIRLLAPFGKAAVKARQCTERFVLSSKRLALQGEGQPEKQQVLRPRALYTLSHLVSGLRHMVPGVALFPVGGRGGQPMVLVEPSPMLSRLGYAVCGDNYRALEQDYAELAGCMVRHETWDADLQRWSITYEEPLVEYFDTGRRCVAQGRELEATGSRRRYRNWRLGLSRPLLEMLQCRASEFAGLAPEFWRAAGQSAPAQWLVCYLCGHGYDAGEFLPHRLDTLAYRMRACPDTMLTELQGESLEVADFLSKSIDGSALPRRATEAQFNRVTKERTQAYGEAVESYGEKQRSLRESIRQVFRGLSRLHKSHAFARVGILGSDGEQEVVHPVAGGGSFRHVSAHDRVTLQRWPALIERHLRAIPAWVFSQHKTLLDSAGKAVGAVASQFPAAKRHLTAILRNLKQAPRASGVAKHHLAHLAWLTASVSGSVSQMTFTRMTSRHAPPPEYGWVGVCPA